MRKEDLMPGARKVMECGGVKEGENVLIVVDTIQPVSIREALYDAAKEYKATANILIMDPVPPAGNLPYVVNEAMKAADYIVAPTSKSIFHSVGMHEAHIPPYNRRGVALSECTEDMLANGGILADFASIRPNVYRVGEYFQKGKRLVLTTPGGTHLEANIEGRDAYNNTGMADKPGMLEGLPTIEVYIAPLETEANGTIVVDASCSGGIGVIEEPIVITIKDGKAVSFEGGQQARDLEKIFSRLNDPNAFQLAEIAVGMNPNARITGCINEDEGKYGTCHCAIGSNAGFGGINEVPVHIDMVQWKPTLEIDGEVIFRDGVLLV